MGVSCSAAIVVGIEVYHEDFWTEHVTTPSQVSCTSGHLPKEPNEKFCSECGGKFGRHEVTRLVASPGLVKIAGDDDPRGRAGELWSPERTRCLDEQCTASMFGIKGLALLCVDGNEDRMDGEPQNVALGFVLHEVIDISSGGEAAPLASHPSVVADLAQILTDLAARLGIDREPMVYLNTGAG